MRYSIGVSASSEKVAPMGQLGPTGFVLLERLARAWRDRVDGPARRAALAAGVASIFAFAHLARVGSPAARLTTAAAMVFILGGLVARSIASRRAWRDPRKIVRRTIAVTDPNLGQRALRAMRLVDRTEHDRSAGSSDLARVHLDRTLSRVGYDDVRARAAEAGRLLERAGLVAGGLGLIAVILGPFRVIEGLDVLVARRGVAPLALQWIEEPSMTAHPPDYLRQRDFSSDEPSHVELPYGSLLTIRGVPLHAGRKLVLVDGTTEVPFVDDAAGQVVARWPLTASAKLRVAARFGSVLVVEPSAVGVTSIADEAPSVHLEGAPRTLKLLETPEIEVRYQATDDHGLREVHLVLRSGDREERRVLARLDGETRHDRGGHRLLASDRFFKRTFGPIEITVEARDNDPLRGPKWGRSAALTIIPPVVGEPEALRYESLERARDAFVDLTAFRIENELAGKPAGGLLRVHALRETEETNRAVSQLEGYMDESFGGLRGLRVSRRIKTLADGQIRKLRETLEREVKRTNQSAHAANRKLTEDFTLTLDAVLKRLDVADSAGIAKRLADVADDAAEAAAQARRPSERPQAVNRLEVGTGILDGGGGQLLRLGALGRDLGEIVGNDLKRARRSRGTDDFFHTELALRDLAARLRHPAPSFGGGQRGGVEAGGGWGTDSDEDGSEGAQKIAREQEQIEELARDHGAELSGVEQAMNSAESTEELEKLRDEARQHAQAVRSAVRPLPRSGGEPSSAEAVAGTAREHAEAMADELEHGSIADAVKSGRNSLEALEQSARAPVDRFSFRKDTREDAKNAQGKLDPEVKWAERLLERLRQAASGRAAEDLKKTSPREANMADRARSIANDGRGGAGALPGQTLDLLQGAESAMREAARSLGAAEGAPALDHLKEAQRLLEMARSSDEGDEGDDGSADQRRKGNKGDQNGETGDFDKHAAIPKAEDYKGPEAFRRRVVDGLGGAADPRLRDAVQRYAEGLLR
jgi:hypothetical protein